jgi:gamma-glutamylcyclotransferase (GGCT)/AIG2-like uncharacterized protein YtfP
MNVFAYGSLCEPAVLKILLKRYELVVTVPTHRVPSLKPAVLSGYKRYRVISKAYPAVLPDPDFQVKGSLMLDITQGEMDFLDSYEGGEYIRKLETVLTDETGEQVEAFVWVWSKVT